MEDDGAKAKECALRRLCARAYASFEMAAYLKKKGYEEPIIDQTVRELTQQGFINDTEWLEAFARSQLRKRQGPRLTAAKLRQRGAGSAMVAKSAELMRGSGAQEEQLAALIQAKEQRGTIVEGKEEQKLIASLMRKGFDFSAIREALEQHKRDR